MTTNTVERDGSAPERVTRNALRACASWLSFCLIVGYPRESLDGLEALWWMHHDRAGRLL